MPNTIVLKTMDGIGRRYSERLAVAAVTPGHIMAVDAANLVKPHNVSGGKAQMRVAIEDALQGRTIDDVYQINDRVREVILLPGDQFWGWIVAGANATPALQMSSNGDGTFKIVAGSEVPLVRPVEAVDNSGGGTASRCKLEVL